METGESMENVFQSADKVCRLVQKELKIEREEIKLIVGRIVNCFHNKSTNKVALEKKEMIVYETLLNNKYNPNTVYRWLLATSSPDEVLIKLRSGEINIRGALKMRNKIRQQFKTDDEKFIKEVIWHVEQYIV